MVSKCKFSLLPQSLRQQRVLVPCFYRVIETLVKVWENSKKLWLVFPQHFSFSKKSVYFSVNFKRFAEGSKKFGICWNSIKRTYGIISCLFCWLTTKDTNSNSIIKNYPVLKMTHKEPFPNLSECAVVPRRFSQKWDVIWSPDHYPCLVLGLVHWKQEKHLWALVFSSYRSSMMLKEMLKFFEIPFSRKTGRNLVANLSPMWLSPMNRFDKNQFGVQGNFRYIDRTYTNEWSCTFLYAERMVDITKKNIKRRGKWSLATTFSADSNRFILFWNPL